MKKKFLLLFILIFSLTNCINAQTEEQKKIEKTITLFFEGFHKRDSLKMKSVISENFTLQSAYKLNDTTSTLQSTNLNDFLYKVVNRNLNNKWEEKLLSFNINIDGTLANAWVKYEFWLNDEFSHCGVNSFHLYLSDYGWKIIQLVDSRRKNNCN